MKAPIDSSAPSRRARNDELGGHAQLAGPGKQRRAHKRPDARRDAEHRRRRQCVQAAAALDVGEARRQVGISRSPRPSSSQSLMPSGFCTSSESGPASIVKPSICSLRITPPSRAALEQHERHLLPRSSYAAASPAMPPPTMPQRGSQQDVRDRETRGAALRLGQWPSRRRRDAASGQRSRSRARRHGSLRLAARGT